jgi:hypothetical protein
MPPEAKVIVPRALRRRVGPVVRALREPVDVTRRAVLSSWRRDLPEVLVIGAAKSGTSSMFFALKQHPLFAAPCTKEVNFFDLEHFRGTAWYRAHFPIRSRAGMVSADASPSYLWDPKAPRRAAQLLPGAKLIALLRDPIARAHSHHQHNARRGTEPLTFEEAVDREEDRTREGWQRMLVDDSYVSSDARIYSYVARGRYVEQLDRWAAHYSKSRMLVLRSEDFYADPAGVFRQVTDFIGIPWHDGIEFEHRNAGGYDDVVPCQVDAHLATMYAPYNERLRSAYGEHLVWQ